jgi:N-glycosylase/DNA lyase
MRSKMMLIAENELFDRVLDEYSQIMPKFHEARKWHEMSENELWQELCLCILSSNVPYELAKSAFRHLTRVGYLEQKWIIEVPNSRKIIAEELQKPLYLPRKIDGSLRKYRFPNVRSRDICETAKIASSKENWISNLLADSSSEIEARNYLVRKASGIGFKEASHFLRNIKYSNELAIIDSHVLSFLREINAVPIENAKTITHKTYMDLEIKLKEICESHNLNLSVFDMAIWTCMRADKR